MNGCPAIVPGDGFVASLMLGGDCRLMTLSRAAFTALSASTMIAGLIGALLTVATALFAYRMLLGERIVAVDAVRMVLRFGIVIALATSWSAYGTLFYRVAVDGPAEISGVLLSAAGDSGERTIATRLQRLHSIVVPVPNDGSTAGQGGGSAGATSSATMPSGSPLRGGTAAGAAAAAGDGGQGWSRASIGTLVLVSTLGAWLATRAAVAFLLMVGPLAILALLFDAGIGLFLGWLRTLIGGMLAVVAVTIGTVLEVDALAELVFAAPVDAFPVAQVGGTAAVFALVLLALILVAFRFVAGMSAPWRVPAGVAAPASAAATSGTSASAPRATISALAPVPPSRAGAIAGGLATRLERERLQMSGASGAAAAGATIIGGSGRGTTAERTPTAATGGGGAGRRGAPRQSAATMRRDRG